MKLVLAEELRYVKHLMKLCLSLSYLTFMFSLFNYRSSKCLCLSVFIPPPDQNFGLDYHTFQHMVGDCPPDFLQLAFNCCNVSAPCSCPIRQSQSIKIQACINPWLLAIELKSKQQQQQPCIC